MKIIAFEALDGAGKSTQIKFLCEYFKRIGTTYKVIKYPIYDSPTGNMISKFLNNEYGSMSPEAVFDLYMTDRMHHAGNFDVPNVDILILDRSNYSNIYYNYYKGDITYDNILRLLQKEWCRGVIKPDNVVYLDTTVDKSLQRIDGRKRDRFETEMKLNQVSVHSRTINLEILENDVKDELGLRVIDGDRTPDKVFLDIKNVVKNILGGF